MEKKGFWQGIWYWYHRHWPLLFDVICGITLIIALLQIFKSFYISSAGIIQILIMAAAYSIIIIAGYLISGFGEEYLIRYDNGCRWIRGLPPRAYNPFHIPFKVILVSFKLWLIKKLKFG